MKTFSEWLDRRMLLENEEEEIEAGFYNWFKAHLNDIGAGIGMMAGSLHSPGAGGLGAIIGFLLGTKMQGFLGFLARLKRIEKLSPIEAKEVKDSIKDSLQTAAHSGTDPQAEKLLQSPTVISALKSQDFTYQM